jgi:acetyl-CoA carboxylase biotin carboxyl carrier protein
VAGLDARWLDTVRCIIEQVRASDVTEVELSQRDFRLRLRRRASAEVGGVDRSGKAAGQSAVPSTPEIAQVLAPLTGVFYRASSPTTEPYVRDGDWVEAGATVGLIETMKILNEVKTEQTGRVERVLVQSGQLVQAGDPLVALAPGERTAPVEAAL